MKPKFFVSLFGMAMFLLMASSVSFAYGKKAEQAAEMPAAEEAPAAAATEDAAATTEGAAQEAPADTKGAMSEEMMAKWKEYATPNENHQILSGLVGDFDYTSKHWMSPDAPAEESSGTSEAEWIMGGRFVEQEFTGTWMNQPFSGMQITGYDNAAKEYVSTWVDNMGTGIMITKGSYDAATKTLTQSGTFNCPFKGEMSMRWAIKFVDENTYIFEMYGPDESGNDFKNMEIVYKKRLE